MWILSASCIIKIFEEANSLCNDYKMTQAPPNVVSKENIWRRSTLFQSYIMWRKADKSKSWKWKHKDFRWMLSARGNGYPLWAYALK